MSNRARRALQKVGLEEEILKCGIPMKGRFIHNLNGDHKSILYDSRTNQCIYSVSRNFLNQKLLEEVERQPNVVMHFNHKLINVDIEEGRLIFLQTITNKKVEAFGDLLIGADGAFSTLRRAMQQTPLFNFSQTYINHGYIEMCIPSEAGKDMVPNHLHIWPRGEFMLIALPNIDDSWTVTLFMSFQRFEELDTSDKVLNFFETVFPDSIKFLGKTQLVKDFLEVKPSTLLSIKCGSFHAGRNAVLIGDAAHAMVPFYGQGMNAGFEDCFLLDAILESCGDDIPLALETFTKKRLDDAHAICDLAMYNFLEMRDLVVRPSYILRKTLDTFLFWMLPHLWVPLYNSVAFSEMNYQQCVNNREWQNKVLLNAAAIVPVFGALVASYLYYSF